MWRRTGVQPTELRVACWLDVVFALAGSLTSVAVPQAPATSATAIARPSLSFEPASVPVYSPTATQLPALAQATEERPPLCAWVGGVSSAARPQLPPVSVRIIACGLAESAPPPSS